MEDENKSDAQIISDAFKAIFAEVMKISEVIGRNDDLNNSVPPEWPLHLSADEFAHECLGMAEHYADLAKAS